MIRVYQLDFIKFGDTAVDFALKGFPGGKGRTRGGKGEEKRKEKKRVENIRMAFFIFSLFTFFAYFLNDIN